MSVVDDAVTAHGPYLRRVAMASVFNAMTSALATALLLPIVIRRVGFATYGHWAVLALFTGVSASLDLGIWKAVVYWMPRKTMSPHLIYGSAMTFCAVISALFGVVIALLIACGIPVFGAEIQLDAGLNYCLAISGCMIVLANLLTNVARGVLEASYRADWVNVGYGFLTLSLYGSATLISFFSTDARILILGSTSVYLGMLIVHLLAVRSIGVSVSKPSVPCAQSLAHYSIRSFVADLPTIVLGPLLLYLFLMASGDSASYGVFDISLRIATLSATAISMLSAPLFAIVAGTEQADRQGIRALIIKQMRTNAALAAGGILVFVVAGRPLLAVFFGQKSEDLFTTTLPLLVGACAVAALEPVTRLLMGLGRLRALAICRYSMLAGAVGALVLFNNSPPLRRFPLAGAIGFVLLATCLAFQSYAERWGVERRQ